LTKVFLKTFQNIEEDSFDLGKDRTEFENWDSLTHMQLVLEVETAFNINFDMDEIVEISKPGDFIPLIEKRKKDN
jgi:acyl carrier protein